MHRALRLFRVGIAVALVMITAPALASKTEPAAGSRASQGNKGTAKATKHAGKGSAKHASKASKSTKHAGKATSKSAAKHPKSGAKKTAKKPHAK